MTNSLAGKHDPIFHQDSLNIVLQHADLAIQQSVLTKQLSQLRLKAPHQSYRSSVCPVRVRAPLLPFSFSPGVWNKGSIQPPSARTKHCHFKNLSILNLNHNNLSLTTNSLDFLPVVVYNFYYN